MDFCRSIYAVMNAAKFKTAVPRPLGPGARQFSVLQRSAPLGLLRDHQAVFTMGERINYLSRFFPLPRAGPYYRECSPTRRSRPAKGRDAGTPDYAASARWGMIAGSIGRTTSKCGAGAHADSPTAKRYRGISGDRSEMTFYVEWCQHFGMENKGFTRRVGLPIHSACAMAPVPAV